MLRFSVSSTVKQRNLSRLTPYCIRLDLLRSETQCISYEAPEPSIILIVPQLMALRCASLCAGCHGKTSAGSLF